MRIALPTWNGIVSPVLDVARVLLVVEYTQDGESARRDVDLAELDFCQRAELFRAMDLDIVICGALSRTLEMMLSGAGITLVTHVCGAVDKVLKSYLSGTLSEQVFRMPGCRGRRNRFRGYGYSADIGNQPRTDRELHGEVIRMPRGDGTGPPGGGQGGRRRGRSALGSGGNCVCPACGRKVPHAPGRPCNQLACPDCGKPMVRE